MMSLDDDRQLAENVGEVLGVLAGATLRAAVLYVDTSQAEHPDRRLILGELIGIASAFRLADAYGDAFEAATGDLDPRPALAVLRVVQDNLILLLSDNAEDRSLSISEAELRARLIAEPVRRFLDRPVR